MIVFYLIFKFDIVTRKTKINLSTALLILVSCPGFATERYSLGRLFYRSWTRRLSIINVDTVSLILDADFVRRLAHLLLVY